ncbi:13232_t:CDS:2, partial [Dentiscutata heterogama]
TPKQIAKPFERKYNYQNYDAIEEYYKEKTLYLEDKSMYEVMETLLSQVLKASFQQGGQKKRDYSIDVTRTNAMMITEKRELTQLYSECYYIYLPKDLLGGTCPECFKEMQEKLTDIQKKEAKIKLEK